MHHQFTPHRYKTIAEMDHNEKGYIRPSSIVWSYCDESKNEIIYALLHNDQYSSLPEPEYEFEPDQYTIPITCDFSQGERSYTIGDTIAEYSNLQQFEHNEYTILAKVLVNSQDDLISVLSINPEENPLGTILYQIITDITLGIAEDYEQEIIEELIEELGHQDIYNYEDTCTILSWIETFYRTNTLDDFFDEYETDANIQSCLYRLLDKTPTGIYAGTYHNITHNPSFQSQLLTLKALYTPEHTKSIDTIESLPTQLLPSEFERLQSELEQAYQENNNKNRVSLLQSAQQALRVAVEQEDYELAEQYKNLINIYKFSIS